MILRNRIIIISFLMIVSLLGCKKFVKKGYMPQAGIALTFDDDRIDNWYKNLPILDSAGIKATFYISNYFKLTTEQKNKLHIIQSHGHEIAYHTVNHYNLVDYTYKFHHTIDEMIQNEITCGLKMMNRDGFYPVTFAYPFGSHNGVLDKELKRYFKSVRALNGTTNYSKSLASTEKNDVLYAFGLDKSSHHSDAVVVDLINSARNNNACVVMVAHNINTDAILSVTKERLLKIIGIAQRENLKFYTISEISN